MFLLINFLWADPFALTFNLSDARKKNFIGFAIFFWGAIVTGESGACAAKLRGGIF